MIHTWSLFELVLYKINWKISLKLIVVKLTNSKHILYNLEFFIQQIVIAHIRTISRNIYVFPLDNSLPIEFPCATRTVVSILSVVAYVYRKVFVLLSMMSVLLRFATSQ